MGSRNSIAPETYLSDNPKYHQLQALKNYQNKLDNRLSQPKIKRLEDDGSMSPDRIPSRQSKKLSVL